MLVYMEEDKLTFWWAIQMTKDRFEDKVLCQRKVKIPDFMTENERSLSK